MSMNKHSLRTPSPALVLAIIALFVSLGGTGYAASQLGSSPTAVAAKGGKKNKPKPKTLRGPAGPKGVTGPNGPIGPTGPQGKEGTPGKEGKEGPKGEQGTAVAYATVKSTATLDAANSSGVVDVQRYTGFEHGFYCLYGNFSPHVATATVNYSESSGGELVQTIGITAGQVKACPASGTGAPAKAIVLVRPIAKPSELIDAGFYIIFN
jgi:collagen triple helix repeat protein